MKIKIDLKLKDNLIEIKEDTEITEVLIARNSDEIKSRIEFIHKRPNLKSRINIKVVVFDQARFDLEGILKIYKGAKGTDTYLKINCLIMGERAYARAIPSLEIQESDVKAGHGATIGYLDAESMYYLKSKGLDRLTTEKLLVEAFLK